jgi:hypothetical protein
MSDMGIGEGLLLSSIIGGGASIAGGALANKGSQTSAVSPTIDPAYQGLQGQVLKMIQQRLSTPVDLTGYTANSVANINKNAGLTKQGADNALVARGLATSPVAGAVDANINTQRMAGVSQLENSIPLLQDSLQRQNLSDANTILQTGRGSTGSSTVSSGGGAAGAFTNLAQYLGYLNGKGVFGKPAGSTSLYGTGGNGTSYAPGFDAGVG